MPKKLTDIYFASLAELIGRFPQGACIRDLIAAIDEPLPQRTLQDHLARLVKQHRVTISGKGVARRYHLPEPQTTSILRESHAELQIDSIPLSAAAKFIRESVSRPLSQRKPVGYNRAFLDDYIPNETYYLPAETRALLDGMGRIYQDNQPAGTYAREIHNRLLIDLSWNSSRLEGNTYSLLETERLLEAGTIADGKDTREAQMILNHKAAIELLLDDTVDMGFNRYTICNLHALLSDHLLADQGACGRLRTKPVGVTATLFHPLGVPQMIEECFDVLLAKADAIVDPFEQAFFVMVQLPYLQPFMDVNKRVSRLAANIPLIRMNLCPLSFVHVPDWHYTGGVLGVYELNAVAYLRDVFTWAYQRSSDRYSAVRQTLGDPDPFLLRHRTQIKTLVGTVVRSSMSKTEAIDWIHAQTDGMSPRAEQKRLVEIVETELMCLHPGNIARYALKPSEFDTWKSGW
ncbi:MAG TPA: cell filamentation protein Fic [Verrucomicrobia bacterium]|nr:cell filamentation protein Fic [Verrucomicrobiota bacterium]